MDAVRCLDGERAVKVYPVTSDFVVDFADAWFVLSAGPLDIVAT